MVDKIEIRRTDNSEPEIIEVPPTERLYMLVPANWMVARVQIDLLEEVQRQLIMDQLSGKLDTAVKSALDPLFRDAKLYLERVNTDTRPVWGIHRSREA